LSATSSNSRAVVSAIALPLGECLGHCSIDFLLSAIVSYYLSRLGMMSDRMVIEGRAEIQPEGFTGS